MTWKENKLKRTLTGKHFKNSQTGKSHFETISGLRLHYANNTAEVDFTPEYVEAGAFEGYRVVRNEWHYAIGAINGDSGWTGMGLRRGRNWLRFKLARVGYFHQPTRNFDFIGGLPNYDLNNLSIETDTIEIGPDGAKIQLKPQTKLTWQNIFNGVDIRWQVNGKQLKEEIVVSETTRNNLPAPSTPLAETWLAMIFEIDANGIGKWLKNNVEQNSDDMHDANGALFMRDDLDRYLGFLPIDYAYAGDEKARLTKRVFRKNGQHYLVVGLKVNDFNALPPGEVIFDPTYVTQPDEADAKDTYLRENSSSTNYGTSADLVAWSSTVGLAGTTLVEFDVSSIPSDATCDSATLSLWTDSTASGVSLDVYSLASGVADWTELGATWDDYKASTAWPGSGGAKTSGTDYEASSIGTIAMPGTTNTETSTALTALRVQGWFGATNTNYGISLGQTTTNNNIFCQFHSSNNGTSAYNPKLSVTYTEAPTPTPSSPVIVADEADVLITDGTTFVNLISDEFGFHLCNWDRVLATWKGGGVWRNPVLGEGRQLQFAKYDNILETLTLKANATSQDDMIKREQDLIRLLNQATDYWLRDDITIKPVYMEVKAAQETNTRYALIHDFRIPQIGNQFSAPYLQPGCFSALDDFDLIVERGHWLSNAPGQDDGVSSSSLSSEVRSATFTPGQNSDTVNLDPLLFVTSTNPNDLGNSTGNRTNVGIRFTSVTIPQGATIRNAILQVLENSTIANVETNIKIDAKSDDNPATFNTAGTYADEWVNVARTTAFSLWEFDDSISAGDRYNVDVTSIVQEIINRAGWSSGNAIAMMLGENGSPAAGDYHALKAYVAGAPYQQLYIEWESGTDYGRTETIENEVYIVNHNKTAVLTHAYYYDASGTSFSSNLIGAALPYDLLPATPANNDILYVGISDDSNNAIEGPFNNIVFDLVGLDATFSTAVFTYWNGAAWHEFTATEQQNNTSDIGSPIDGVFFVDGVCNISFTPQSDWAKTTINGVSAYWVRILIGISSPTNTPEQQNRQLYTANTSIIDIANDIIGGDIRALIRGNFESQSGTTNNEAMYTNRFIFGARELLSTDYFTSFLNCTDFQNGAGVTVTVGAQTTEGDADIVTANGERSTFTATGTTNATRVTWDIADFAAQSYYGTFRVFFRGKQHNKAGTDFAKVNIQVETGSGGVTFTGRQVAFEYTNDWQLLDLGTIRIPTSSLFTSSEISDTIILNLQIQAGTTADVVYCYDMCLIPTYDYAGDFIDKANTDASRIGFRRYIEIDSTSQPKVDIRAIVSNTETDKLTGVLQTISSDKFTLESNANLRLYFLFARYGDNDEWVSEPWACYSVQLFKNQRYITARGEN